MPSDHLLHRRNFRRTIVPVFLLAAALAGAAMPGRPGRLIAQPTTYESVSGKYTLRVDPRDRYGSTDAVYRFSKSGETVWLGERPYTLRAVSVTNNGAVIGIAYHSVPAESADGRKTAEQYFHAIILDGQGHELLNDATLRRHSMHTNPPTPAVPFAEQILVDEPNDRVLLRVMDYDCESPVRRGPSWVSYRISDGQLISRFNPHERLRVAENMRWVLDVKPVHGTPLLAVHWYTKGPDYQVKDAGASFMLIDINGETIWRLDAEADYAEIDFDRRRIGGGISGFFETNPAILQTDKPRQLDIRLFTTNERVSLAVKPSDDGWVVNETSRKELAEASSPGTDDVGEAVGVLEYLGAIELGGSASSPFTKVVDFTFDGDGKIHFWRRHAAEDNSLVTVDPETGDIIKERPFAEIDDRFCLHWTDTPRVREKSFVLMKRMPRGDEGNPAYLVEFATGARTQLDSYSGAVARGFARCNGGGYLVIQDGRFAAYDSNGTERWAYATTDDKYYNMLGMAKDVTVMSDKRIAVLTFGKVELFDWDGEHIKSVDLTGAFGTDEFGGRPGYLHEIIADAKGGFILQNYRNPPVVLRYTSDGELKSRWSPRHPDGRTFDIRPGVRVAPSGRIWTSDGESIVRLTGEGVVDRVLGQAPDVDQLGEVAGLTVAFDGTVYVVAKRAGGVHVFNDRGVLERIDAPEPTDLTGTVREAFIAVTDTGDHYVQRPGTRVYMPADKYLHFSPTGERIGSVTFKPRLSTTKFGPGWAFQPSTGYRCGFSGGETLSIIDPPETVVREIAKRPNGKWFSYVAAFAMAPDGSMAVLGGELGDDSNRREVDIFSPEGDPIRSIKLPGARKHFSGLAFDGNRVFVAGNEEVLVIDVESGAIQRWDLTEPGVAEAKWQAFLVAGRSELWLHERSWNVESATIHRYRLP